MNAARLALAGLALLALAGCASEIRPEIAAPARIASGSSAMFVETAPGELAERTRAEVARALVARGLEIAERADLGIEVAVAQRDPGLGFANGETAAPADSGHGLALCRRHVLRIGIALVELPGGNPRYRGAAEAEGCGAVSDDDIAAQVRAALGGLTGD